MSEITIEQTRAGRWSAWRDGKLLGWVATRDGARSWQVYVRRDEHAQEGELVDSAPDRDAALDRLRSALVEDDVCPTLVDLARGYDDPITIAYGAGDVISLSIEKHQRECSHPYCVDERAERGMP